ncbi:MAG: hypothetical protein GY774_05540 [Planctomycetes bacterium]|nr:hypothetical protein [Planctomycetota bacterium]
MKKKAIVISIILLALVIVTTGVWVLSVNKAPLIPSFHFLADQKLKLVNNDYEYDTSCNAFRYVYSFVGDYNDIYSIASNELRSLGYIKEKNWGQGKFWTQSFYYSANPSKGFTRVLIHERQKLNPRSTPDLVMYRFRDGWISVEIIQATNKSWWINYANQLLNRTRLKRAD